MRERIKGFFGAVGGFFINAGKAIGRFLSHPVTVGVIIGLLLIALIGGLVYLALDDTYYRGRVYELAVDNLEKAKTIDRAAVESGQLIYERDNLLGANKQLIAGIEQLQAQMANMFPLEAIQWCDAFDEKVLPEEMRDIVVKTAAFGRGITPDVKFNAVCVSVDEILISQLQGEMTFRVIRYYPSGDRDWLIVYWRLLPGSTEGGMRTAEYINVLTREHCWLDDATQSWLCEKPKR